MPNKNFTQRNLVALNVEPYLDKFAIRFVDM